MNKILYSHNINRLSTPPAEINAGSAIINAVKEDYLPSKRIGFLIIAIVILALGVFFYTTRSNSGEGNLVSLEERQDLEQMDTDGDGLSDWEESLWGTSINNPDTDGDGTNDGDEVAQNRDPLTPGPDDAFQTPSRTDSGDDGEDNQSPDRTTDIKAEVLPRALALAAARQSGEDISEEDIGQIANSLDTDELLEVETFTESDLNTTTNLSRSDLESYVQETVRIFSIESPEQRNPLTVMASEIQNGQPGQINLSPYITQMDQVVAQLREVPVPTAYIADHLVILNSAARMRAGLEAMQWAKTDAMSGVLGAEMYRNAMREAEDAATRLSENISNDIQ